MVATAPVLEGDMLESSSPSDILFWLVRPIIVMSRDWIYFCVTLSYAGLCSMIAAEYFTLLNSTLLCSVVSLILYYHLIL